MIDATTGDRYIYLKDGRNSVYQIQKQGVFPVEISKTYQYDSFGNIISETGTLENPFAYTGREWEPDLGLYYYRARWYDPAVGRFLSEDPIGFSAGDPNIFRYVGNNPVNFVDPWGLFNIITGAGFSAVGVTGVEGSIGTIYNFDLSPDVGYFVAGGIGGGVNVSADVLIGFIPGNFSDVSGVTANTNLTIGPFSFTSFVNPETGEFVGGTFGFGPGAAPIGASGTGSVTETFSLTDFIKSFFQDSQPGNNCN